VVVSTDAVDQSRCRVENGLQSAELTGRKSSQDSVACSSPTALARGRPRVLKQHQITYKHFNLHGLKFQVVCLQ